MEENLYILTNDELRLLQLNELELLLEFDRVCKKNNIKYSMDGGTLLGAVRHKGFIPWDDDVDVMLTSEEYEKFFQACKEDLNHDKFFFQDYRNDEGYRWGYGKLRRKGTEYVKSGHEKAKYKTGVCIDVFRFDPIPDNPKDREGFLKRMFCVRKIQYSEIGRYNSERWFLRLWYALIYKIPKRWIPSIQKKLLKKYELENTQNIINSYLPFNRQACRYGYPRKWFDNFVELEFEGFHFPAISDYDSFLKMKYGDYMQLPPDDKRVGVMKPVKLELLNISMDELNQLYD